MSLYESENINFVIAVFPFGNSFDNTNANAEKIFVLHIMIPQAIILRYYNLIRRIAHCTDFACKDF